MPHRRAQTNTRRPSFGQIHFDHVDPPRPFEQMNFVVDHTGGQLLDVAIARDTSDQQDQAE